MGFSNYTENSFDEILNIVSKDNIYKDRTIDPRLQYVTLYVSLKRKDVKNLLKAFPKAKVEYSRFKKVKSNPYKIDELIKQHDVEVEKQLEYNRENHVIF